MRVRCMKTEYFFLATNEHGWTRIELLVLFIRVHPCSFVAKTCATNARGPNQMDHSTTTIGRRAFIASTGIAGAALSPAAAAPPPTGKEKLARIASNTWPIRY